MPTNRKRTRRNSKTLDYWRLSQLIDGHAYLIAGPGCGYFPEGANGGCGSWTEAEWDDWRGQILADWQQHGAAVLSWWRGENERFSAIYASIGGKRRDPSVTPWVLTEFGEP